MHDDEQTDNADNCDAASTNEWILLASLLMFSMNEDVVVGFNVLHEMLKLLNLNFVSHLFHLKLAWTLSAKNVGIVTTMVMILIIDHPLDPSSS